ncbi:MAG: hypothetical protein PHY47_00455 [Lachnospiraceae bacterium]|nr:hypothetical protein [Lachnospiraceae bacterium]
MNASATEIKKTLPQDASRLMFLRQQAQTLQNIVLKDKINKDAPNAIVENMSREGQDTATHLQYSISGRMPNTVLQQAQTEVERYLTDGNTPNIDIKKFGAFDGVLENSNANQPESEYSRAERERLRDIQSDTIIPGVQITDGGFDNGATLETQAELADRAVGIFGKRAGQIVKECIPCGIRKFSLGDLEVSNPFANTMEDLKNKLKELSRLLEGLLLSNAAEMDLCDLLSLLEAQCLPDLFAMLSMLGILQMKYAGNMNFNIEGALNSIIAPFLAPVIGPLVTNLEKYIDLIVDPLICVVEALESQMYKITSIDPKAQMEAYQKSYNRKQITFYEQKIAALEKRKRTINSYAAENNYELRQEFSETNSTININGEELKVVNSELRAFERYPITTPFANIGPTPDSQSKGFIKDTVSNIKDYSNALISERDRRSQSSSADIPYSLLGKNSVSLDEEMERINEDIEKSEVRIRDLAKENNDLKDFNRGDTYENTKKAREFKKGIHSAVYQMTQGLNDGIQGIKDTLNMYRLELEKTITGRVQTQEDLIELTRDIQKYQRWISIVNALIKLKQSGGSLSEICKHGNSAQAMGAFVGEFKNQASGSSQDFYRATDDEGNELMIIAPGGAKLNVTSLEFEELGTDELLHTATINEVQNTATYNDIGEADKLNRKGTLLDLGNISGKDITLSLNDATGNKTSLDLKAERSYVIIKNDFCSKSPFKTGTSDSIRKWAENIL